jgi:glycosyltransferase involved in cell wall biosynthesis
MEKPVIATPIGGIGEVVVDGETGLLVAPHDVEALSAALERLLADEKLRATMGTAGRRRAIEEFSLERMVEETQKVYRETIAAYRPRRGVNKAPPVSHSTR